MRRNKRHGFSLTELVIVIIIIAILAALGFTVGGKQIEKSREKTTTNRTRALGSEVENAIVDLGFLDVEVLKTNNEAVRNYFSVWDANYLSSPIDTASIHFETTDSGAFAPDYVGVWMETTSYKDSWDSEMRIYYLAPAGDTGLNRIVIASAGPNAKFSDDAAKGYINGEFDDDIVLIMEPRTHI